MNPEFTIEYVELPNGRIPAREFVNSLDDKAAARIDAFIDRLRVYGNRMQGKFVNPKGVGIMRRDRHSEFVEQRRRKSAAYRQSFARALQQIDLALLVREMREGAGLTQMQLARKVDTTQSVIARLEDAEYKGHSLTMLERIATACGVALKLHAQKKPHFNREVTLV